MTAQVSALRSRTDEWPVSLVMLPVADLVPGDDFRLDDDPADLAELAASIAEVGVLQPLVVRQTAAGWEVVAGRRRLAAARAALLDVVPCIVRPLDDDSAMDIALAENLHRRWLSPIEQAMAFDRLRKRGLTQKQIAERVGRSDFYVSVHLRLLEMPAAIRKKVHTGKMSYSTAYDHWKRELSGKGQGGVRTRGRELTGDDTVLVSHWRRRHDRLLAGIHAILKARPIDVPAYRMMLDRLLKLDTQSLSDTETSS